MRGVCGNCGHRRVLRGGLCQSCIREDNDGQREHEEFLADLDAPPIQVTIHGKYGRGPMPVEFRDALVRMLQLVKQGIDDGSLPLRKPRGG